MNLTLVKALRINSPACVAFIGAGGKSTALFKLARELTEPVIVTATSHLGIWQIPLADRHVIADVSTLIKVFDNELHGIILVTGEIEGQKAQPIDSQSLASLYSFCMSHSISLLVEADGSRQKPLKAWADYEPPIPEFASHVVQTSGMSGLGKPLTDEFIHRARIFSILSGLPMGKSVTPESLIKVLTHKYGGLKNIRSGVKTTLILNQSDTSETQSIANTMIDDLLIHYQSVVVASLKDNTVHAVHERTAGIILAAGGSTRFGEPKQLLKWKGEPFIRVVAQTALRAGLSPVIVVTGANAEKVEPAINDLNVTISRNSEWNEGQAGSIREGIRSIPGSSRSAIFLLSDQPQVNLSILRALQDKHAEGLYPIVAPMVIDRRANPVLFDRTTFQDLLTIEGDTGGRAIFHKHRVEYLPWHDDSLLLDVDTPEQYQKLIANKEL